MVETSGFEPPTPWLQTRCSPVELRPPGSKISGNAGVSLVGPGRFELPTSPLSGARSDQLSYEPALIRQRKPRQCPGFDTSIQLALKRVQIGRSSRRIVDSLIKWADCPLKI